MIILGVILLIAALLVPQLAVLWTIGLILILVGVVFLTLSYAGHPVGGRRHWF